MSIEFVEPTEPAAVGAPPAAARPSATPGRLLGVAALLSAGLVAVAVSVQFYVVDKTSFVVDFDGTATQDARVPYDAFGRAGVASVTAGRSGPESRTLSVSLADGIAYAPWWLAAAGVLLLLAAWAVVRPRSPRPGGPVAALGGLLLGSVGAAWLQIRTVTGDSVAQIRFAAHAGVGLWLLVAAGGLAVLGGVLHVTRPPVRRLFRSRRHGRSADPRA